MSLPRLVDKHTQVQLIANVGELSIDERNGEVAAHGVGKRSGLVAHNDTGPNLLFDGVLKLDHEKARVRF